VQRKGRAYNTSVEPYVSRFGLESATNMLEGWVVDWINSACGRFLKKFDEKHVKISITGNVYLNDIEIDVEAFGNLLNLPFEPVSIFIGSVHIDVPLLPSSELIIKVSDVLVVCSETVDVSRLSAFLSQKALQKLITLFYLRKEAELRRAWADASPARMSNTADADADADADGSTAAADATVELRKEYALGLLKRLSLTLERMHVRMEDGSWDSHSCPRPRSDGAGSVMIVGVLVHSLQLVPCSESTPFEDNPEVERQGAKYQWPDTGDAAAAAYDACFCAASRVPSESDSSSGLRICKLYSAHTSVYCSREKSVLWALTAEGVSAAKKAERGAHTDEDDDSECESDASTADGEAEESVLWSPRTVELQVPLSTDYVQKVFTRCAPEILIQKREQKQRPDTSVCNNADSRPPYFRHIASNMRIQALAMMAFTRDFNSLRLLAPVSLNVRTQGMDLQLDEASTLFGLHLAHLHLTFIYRLQRRCKIANANVPKSYFTRMHSSPRSQKSDPEADRAILLSFKSWRARCRWKLIKQCIHGDWQTYTASLDCKAGLDKLGVFNINPLLGAAVEANKLWNFMKSALQIPGGYDGGSNSAARDMTWRSWFHTWKMCGKYIALRELLLYHVNFARDATQDGGGGKNACSLPHERLHTDWNCSESGDEGGASSDEEDTDLAQTHSPAGSQKTQFNTQNQRNDDTLPGSKWSRTYRGIGSVGPDYLVVANALVREHLNRPDGGLSNKSAPHIKIGPLRALYALQLELDAILPPPISALCRAEANDRFRAQQNRANKLANEVFQMQVPIPNVKSGVPAVSTECEYTLTTLPSHKSVGTADSGTCLSAEPTTMAVLLIAIADCVDLPALYGLDQVHARCVLTVDKGSVKGIGIPSAVFETAAVCASVSMTNSTAHVSWPGGFENVGVRAATDGAPSTRSVVAVLHISDSVPTAASASDKNTGELFCDEIADKVKLSVRQSSIFAPITFDSNVLRISELMGPACRKNLSAASTAFIANGVFASTIESCSHILNGKDEEGDGLSAKIFNKINSGTSPSIRLFTRLVVCPVQASDSLLSEAKVELENAAVTAAAERQIQLQEAATDDDAKLASKGAKNAFIAYNKNTGFITLKSQALYLRFTYGLLTGSRAIYTPLVSFDITGPCMWMRATRNPYKMSTRMRASSVTLTLAGSPVPILSIPSFAATLDFKQTSDVGKYIDRLLDESCFKWAGGVQMGPFSATLFPNVASADSTSPVSDSSSPTPSDEEYISGRTVLYEHVQYKSTMPHLAFNDGASAIRTRTHGMNSGRRIQRSAERAIRTGSGYARCHQHLNVPEYLSLNSSEAVGLEGKINRKSDYTWQAAENSLKLGVSLPVDVETCIETSAGPIHFVGKTGPGTAEVAIPIGSDKHLTITDAASTSVDIQGTGNHASLSDNKDNAGREKREKEQRSGEQDKAMWSRERLLQYIAELEANGPKGPNLGPTTK